MNGQPIATQVAAYEARAGYGQCNAVPESNSEAASREWAFSWNRLKQAEAAMEAATHELNEARGREQNAWDALEGASGRAPVPQKPCDPRRY